MKGMSSLFFQWKRKEITEKQFQKLKDKFLTKEQSLVVELKWTNDLYWLIHRENSGGFTQACFKKDEKSNEIRVEWISVRICLLEKNEDLITLLWTIAHEFAHVYLAFNNSTENYDGSIKHDKEHAECTKKFFAYLVTNYRNKN